jgi:hypothetical protein
MKILKSFWPTHMCTIPPPSPIKATPTLVASEQDHVCPMSFSNAGDFMMMSSSQKKGIHVNCSTPTINSLSAKSVLVGEKLVATYSIFT